MFKAIKVRDIVILILLILFTVVAIYFYVNRQARNQLWVQAYPLRAQLSLVNIKCSANSPLWLKDIIIEQTKSGNAPSNEIAYIDQKGQVYHCESGYMGQYPIISDSINAMTRFRYASVTKLWTSDAVLDLVKQGKIQLDDPLAKYIYEIHDSQDSRINDITIRQLLLHRAGFDRNSLRGHDMFGIGEPICPNNFERLNNISLDFTPDEKFGYSNLGYCLLGEVVSRVNNQPYTEAINNSYKFNNTTLKFITNEKLPDEVDYNYVETGLSGLGNLYDAFDYQALASSAGLSGNAIDLAKQAKIMADKPQPNILSLDEYLSCDLARMRDCYGYAMFAYQDNNGGQKAYFRDGKLPGLSSLLVITEDGQVVALLSNGNPQNSEQANDKIKYLIYQRLNVKSISMNLLSMKP